MDKTIRIVTYSTIGIICMLPFMIFLIGGGWWAVKVFLLFSLGMAGLFLLVNMLNKFLSVEWVYSIMVLLLIIALHFLIESWLFDVLTVILAVIFYVVTFKLNKKVWSYGVIFAFVLLWVYAYSFDGFHVVPDISESVLDETEKEMARSDGVDETFIKNEEDRLYCTMNVTSDVSKNGKKKLAQMCAGHLSQMIADDQDIKGPSGDHLGDVYDDYEFIVMINETDDDSTNSFLHGVKGTSSDKIIWQRTGSDTYEE